MSNDQFGIGGLVRLFFIMIPFTVLGLWKLVDIIVWVLVHVRISIR
jgi:uncharacterized membrane protein